MTPETVQRHHRRRSDDQEPSIWFKIMAALGAIVLLLVIGLELTVATINAFQDREISIEIPHMVLYLAMIVGFVGFYGLNPRRAREGGDFILSAGERIITVLRTGKIAGRRSTDTAVITTAETEIGSPPPPNKTVEGG